MQGNPPSNTTQHTHSANKISILACLVPYDNDRRDNQEGEALHACLSAANKVAEATWWLRCENIACCLGLLPELQGLFEHRCLVHRP